MARKKYKKRSSKPFPTKLFKEAYSEPSSKEWFVYVLQSESRLTKKGVGYTYVGATNNPSRRLRQHNGELLGGARSTLSGRPWTMKALFGPYADRREAMRAEYALKHRKRGENRFHWVESDSKWCRGLGVADNRLAAINEGKKAFV